MNNDLKAYIENMEKPWSKLFYRIVWAQLPKVSNVKILDFGSGLGITANHLAQANDVTAIEPNCDMVEVRKHDNDYVQIIGSIEKLKTFSDNCFDVVLCHNVFEYAEAREEILRELYRVVKPNGIISIVKHNHNGRIMSKIVMENNLDEAIRMLNGDKSSAAYFGNINYYLTSDITEWISDLDITIEKVLGVRTFLALNPNNEIRYDPVWTEKMFKIEMMVCDISDYVNIAFYNHVILRKTIS